jgi:hypothetical protein
MYHRNGDMKMPIARRDHIREVQLLLREYDDLNSILDNPDKLPSMVQYLPELARAPAKQAAHNAIANRANELKEMLKNRWHFEV